MKRAGMFFLAVLVGCAANLQRAQTPSGLPEVVISGVDQKVVVDSLTNRMLNRGWVMRSATDYQAIYEHAGGWSTLGSDTRVTFTFAPVESGLRLIVSEGVVADRRSDRVSPIDVGKGVRKWQKFLEDFRDRLSRR